MSVEGKLKFSCLGSFVIFTEVIPDRKEAIGYALKKAKSEDIVILAGKGHETYQVIGKEKLHFDEREIVAEFLA